jgi:hypothetical protein
MDNKTKQRRLIIRIALVIFWICLGVVLFVLNRGHSLLVDNHSVEELNLRASDLITVTVDKLKPLEFFRNDRDIFKVGGGKHKVTIEFSDGTETFTARFSLPLKGDMFILSIPKMINGIEPYFEVFVNNEIQNRNDDEEPLPGSETEAPLAL